MENMSPQQQHESLDRSGGQHECKKRMKSLSYRRQSAPSLVLTKALTRSRTVSRESFQIPLCPELCPLVQSFLASSDRSFLLHGHAQLKTGLQTQDRHLFLFNDILVIAKAKTGNHFKQKAQVRVCEMWTAGCMQEVYEGSTNPERGFVMGWPTCNCVAIFSSAELKERWLSLLKSRMKEEKENEEPKTIPLKVFGKGINSFAPTKTLPVSNSDSTNEVVRLALQQFGIAGNLKDYQLWVISKRDTPYPLIGHEFPFSIQMSHVREPLAQGSSNKDATPPPDRQGALQPEQLEVGRQCQFILKPRPVAESHPHVTMESSQKSFKRRRSLMNWAFWRGSSPQLHDSSMSFSCSASTCLFGQPLSAVCSEDALPKPIMDMLLFLYHEGAWTRGIFRRSAGARAVRELRDSVDAGLSELPLTRDHVFVIAGVFKDFMRSVPGSLLCFDLYEEWLDVLEDEEEEEGQIQDIQRLIGRLPKENALLLQYLVALLRGIQGNSRNNQMTSFNLSVCIAPSMLWPPGPCSPEVEGQGTKKVCELVKFMIDHCQQIFGQDPTSLFGGLPQTRSSEETGSDTWPYLLTDSSYDSLENELDDYSSSGSPAPCPTRGRLGAKVLQGSLESILTLSDYEPDTDPDTRCRGTTKAGLGRSRPGQGAPHEGTSPSPEPLTTEGHSRQRRRSEPAIAYTAKFHQGDRLTREDEDNDLRGAPAGHTWAPTQNQSSGCETRFAALDMSASSLSSIGTSSAPTCSSLDSLDSPHGRERTRSDGRGRRPPKALLPSCLSAVASDGGPKVGLDPKDSPSKEPLCWWAMKGSSRGLHPNSWLKKARRLSLTQQDNKEEEGKSRGTIKLPLSDHLTKLQTAGSTTREGAEKRRTAQEGTRLPPHNSSGHPPDRGSVGSLPCPGSPLLHRTPELPAAPGQLRDIPAPAGSDVEEPKPPAQAIFYRQRGLALSLFRRHKSNSLTAEEKRGTGLNRRRASEPGLVAVDRASTLRLERLSSQAALQKQPSDPAFVAPEVDAQRGQSAGPWYCPSPCATKAVRDYCLSHPHSKPQSAQQVALAAVESRREWLQKHGDPKVETHMDRLLFTEESYV